MLTVNKKYEYKAKALFTSASKPLLPISSFLTGKIVLNAALFFTSKRRTPRWKRTDSFQSGWSVGRCGCLSCDRSSRALWLPMQM